MRRLEDQPPRVDQIDRELALSVLRQLVTPRCWLCELHNFAILLVANDISMIDQLRKSVYVMSKQKVIGGAVI